MLKCIADFTLSLFALILLSPVILVVVWQIRRKQGRPAFFRQTRPGMYDKPFLMVKFCTMVDAVGRLVPYCQMPSV
ncbi:MAG: sugar transferase [Desulfobulbaceae bacterium]|nr:sugar transferase [Desulfobulbaceae bacterium]